jgi:hypothetical protein
MSNTLEHDEWWATPPGTHRPGWLKDGWLWSLAVLMAWIVFEFSAHASLAAIVLCLKFGFKDAATGWWLL